MRNERFGSIRLTHVNLDDGTAEGFAFLDIPAFSVQYHPEAAPGPTDAHYLLTAFTRLMEGVPDYLDIDIAALIVNTPDSQRTGDDSYALCRAAVSHGVFCATTLAGAQAMAAGMQAAREGELDVVSLQAMAG
nr:hypothetical protein [uncultured Adlercreutzia sp.]